MKKDGLFVRAYRAIPGLDPLRATLPWRVERMKTATGHRGNLETVALFTTKEHAELFRAALRTSKQKGGTDDGS